MIQIPVSVGELIDKLSILHVKKNKIVDETKLDYVNKEFEILYNISSYFLNDEKIINLYHSLVETNSSLWDVEDKLREYEKLGIFEGHFVKLARQVYTLNDERFEKKNMINEISNSEIREQKSYQDYKTINESEDYKEKYIFESPDGGITVYRRKIGEPHDKRELISNGQN
jgi:hypothetical protein